MSNKDGWRTLSNLEGWGIFHFKATNCPSDGVRRSASAPGALWRSGTVGRPRLHNYANGNDELSDHRADRDWPNTLGKLRRARRKETTQKVWRLSESVDGSLSARDNHFPSPWI
jgi:hypothetical protein